MSRLLVSLLTAAVASVVSAAGPPPGPASGPADILFHNGSIYTVTESNRKVSALAVKDGYIQWLGGGNSCALGRFIGSKTKVVDLQGQMMMPGLVDAHMHVLEGGKFLLTCNLNYQTLSKEEVLAHVQGCLDSDGLGPDDWMEVVNMDFPGVVSKSGLVTKLDLDQGLSTTRPVFLRSSDYHTIWANSRALEMSDITADSPNPANGVIERMPGSNEPSGLLQDDARSLIAIPPPTLEQDIENAKAALKLLREEGITTFQDAVAFEGHNEVYGAIKAEGGLSARIYCDYMIDSPSSLAEVKPIVDATVAKIKAMNDPAPISPKPTIKWQAIKGFVDGVITFPALTAAMVDDYLVPRPNDNGTNADPYWPPAILAKTLEELFLAGIDAQLHTDGDMAVKVALDAAAAFKAKYPSKKDFRLGLAHDEVTLQSDWGRFAKLGVDAIMSFQWAQLSSFYVPDTFNALGEYRHDKLQCHPQIEAAGRPVVYGSDWPIDPLDEFLALKVGVTRSGDPLNPNSPAFQDPVYDGPFPSRAEGGLTREQAIKAITINAAKFLRADDKIGSLARGKIADMIILERNFFEVPDEELGRNRVLVTVVGGEVVYVADDAGDFLRLPDGGLQAKFPNHAGVAARSTIGGFAGKGLDLEEKMKVKKLRHRGACAHKH
ncbi:amidohydrolase ytcj-like protein [Rhypophila decipiens]|uniref:Amidohydrolase ytcj-like protein n=1 Tax=Rhypophila decipiens TaxID=261697 RepID=A0AAN6Y9M7_9PEZI|nr:amidohydrolase ytcj-like protein [Rhypophila decipiens]